MRNEDVCRRLLPSEILDLRSSQADDTSGRASEEGAREEGRESLPIREESLPEKYPGSYKAGAERLAPLPPPDVTGVFSGVVLGFCAVVEALSLAGRVRTEWRE